MKAFLADLWHSLRHNLSHLASFSGRDTRAQFWPYAICLFLLSNVAMMVLMLPPILDSMRRMQQFAMQHPDQASVVTTPISYSITIHGSPPGLMPDFGAILHLLIPIFAVAVVLYAAAVARRLHDRGKTGLWGLMPLPFIAFSSIKIPEVFANFTQDQTAPAMGQFFEVFASNALYMASLVLLIFLLAGPGMPGDNPYGPDPSQ